VSAHVVKKDRLKAKHLNALVRRHVDVENAILFTDEYKGYLGIKTLMSHQTVNHRAWYVADDGTHTNSIESFWALLKRGIVGQYHKVSVDHLPKYIDVFSYCFNHRKTPDVTDQTIARAVGAAS
jgi:hypothetical protein